jgi:hypothetical protein
LNYRFSPQSQTVACALCASWKSAYCIPSELAYNTGIAKAIRYPLTATCLSKAECKKIDKILLATVLPAMGFPRPFPHKFARAQPEVLSLGIPLLWNDQGIDDIAAMLRHGDSNPLNTTGCLLRDELATLRLELGLPGFLFKYPFKLFHACTTQVHLH